MGCQPCEERKARLQELAADGTPLPGKDWAFYAGWTLAVAAAAAAGFLYYRSRRGVH